MSNQAIRAAQARALKLAETAIEEENYNYKFKKIKQDYNYKPSICRLINQDATLQWAIQRGVYPGAIFRAIEKIGINAVKDAINLVAGMQEPKQTGAYLMTVIKSRY